MKLSSLLTVVAARDFEKSSSFSCNNNNVCSLKFNNGPTFKATANDEGLLVFKVNSNDNFNSLNVKKSLTRKNPLSRWLCEAFTYGVLSNERASAVTGSTLSQSR